MICRLLRHQFSFFQLVSLKSPGKDFRAGKRLNKKNNNNYNVEYSFSELFFSTAALLAITFLFCNVIFYCSTRQSLFALCTTSYHLVTFRDNMFLLLIKWLINYIFTTYSQTSTEAFLLPESSGTWGHKGDVFLQCDRGCFYVWPQERSVFPLLFGVCWRQASVSLFYELKNSAGLCGYAIHHTGAGFTSDVIFSWTGAKLSLTSCFLLPFVHPW